MRNHLLRGMIVMAMLSVISVLGGGCSTHQQSRHPVAPDSVRQWLSGIESVINLPPYDHHIQYVCVKEDALREAITRLEERSWLPLTSEEARRLAKHSDEKIPAGTQPFLIRCFTCRADSGKRLDVSLHGTIVSFRMVLSSNKYYSMTERNAAIVFLDRTPTDVVLSIGMPAKFLPASEGDEKSLSPEGMNFRDVTGYGSSEDANE